jgi:hypothetical protein
MGRLILGIELRRPWCGSQPHVGPSLAPVVDADVPVAIGIAKGEAVVPDAAPVTHPSFHLSILVRQQERRRAVIGLGDDPKAVFTVTLTRLSRIDRVRAKDARAVLYGSIVGALMLGAHDAPIAAHVTLKAVKEAVRRRLARARRTKDLA